MSENPYEVKRTLLKREVVKYYEQKNENGNRQICKETEATTWFQNDQKDVIYISNDEVRHNPTIATTVEYY